MVSEVGFAREINCFHKAKCRIFKGDNLCSMFEHEFYPLKMFEHKFYPLKMFEHKFYPLKIIQHQTSIRWCKKLKF